MLVVVWLNSSWWCWCGGNVISFGLVMLLMMFCNDKL